MIARTSYPKQGSIVGGRYRLLAELGKGGMGRVYQALDNDTGERKAVKLLKSEYVTQAKIVTRFQREAELAATLNHEHICPVTDHGLNKDGTPYLVMPLLIGRTLHRHLKEQTLNVSDAKRYTVEILETLQVAHDRRIVHRDLKPSNIMLASRSHHETKKIVILDFGISKLLGKENSLTTAGGSLGTPAYMAPEQAASLDVDHRIDIYAMGVILYEMLTGHRPFEGETPKSIRHKIAVKVPLLPSRFNPTVSKGFQKVVVTALAHDPRDRFASADEMKTALLEADRGAVSGVQLPAQEQTAREVPVNRGHNMDADVSSTRPNEIRISDLNHRKR